ncbi:MAG: MerR family transcriptional regulator [Candidatus Limivicinus sp.]|nr:MerR family transcriptional regulator [Clostridiales bacterium]MCI7136238.1 MerR family transcriptional regulator [Clostridiales bacterium]MDY6132362.1 MerR family transcriptional regulator [Candidatus Limivicinus sp.]
MYTIGQVSKMFGLPVSTLRYYDKEGLFPDMERSNGIRRFGQRELEALRVIECLKKSGMEIKDIRQFMEWCAQGSGTYPQRRAMFIRQKESVEAEIARMNRVLDMLSFKCWYYEQAIKDGNEQRLSAMTPEDMPEEIRQAWLRAHEQE